MNGSDEYNQHDVQGEPPEEEKANQITALKNLWAIGKLRRQVLDSILDGSTDGWAQTDRSFIDFGCIKELLPHQTFQWLEMLWSWAPIGDKYRDPGKGGHGYLLRTYDRAKQELDDQAVAMQQMKGPNWQIVQPIYRYSERRKTYFEFGVEMTGQAPVRVTVPTDALLSPRDFKKHLYGAGLFIDLDLYNTEDQLRTLAELLKGHAVEQPLPEMGSYDGQLIDLIRGHVISNLDAERKTASIAWRDGQNVYVNARRLTRAMLNSLLKPTAPEIWAGWQRLGGWPEKPDVWGAPVSRFPASRP